MSWRALLTKDLRRELRSKESLQAGLLLVGLFFVLYLFLGATMTDRVATIALWTPLLYATVAMTGRGLASEADRGTLEWVRAAAPAGAIGLSRVLVDLLLSLLLAAATLLVIAAFAVPITAQLALVVLLGALGLSLAGGLAGALAVQVRAREVVAPLLLLPAAAPLLQAGVHATLDALGGTWDATPVLLMAGYDLIIAGVAWLLWPLLLEAD